MSAPAPDMREAAARRLADRYVLHADAASRAVFLGTSGAPQGSAARLVSLLVRTWPKIKSVPVLGTLAYAAFRAIRSLARKGGR